MTMLPVVTRELRAEARHPFTYWGRVLAMAGMLGMVVVFVVTQGLQPGGGAGLFLWLHRTLLCLVWVLVPMMTADVISRERREGTLGLLFLTPLKPWDIVVAKSVAHGLRAFSFCLAVLPVLTIPFLAGGVSWMEAAMSAMFILGSLCCAIGAGVLASSWCRAWIRAVLWAEIIAAGVMLLFACAHLLGGLLLTAPFIPGFEWADALRVDRLVIVLMAFGYVVNWEGLWSEMLSRWFVGPGKHYLLAGLGGVTLLAFGLMLAMLSLAARNVRRKWRDLPTSRFQAWLERLLCRPVLLRKTLRRWLRWKLERNPIGWLEQRTWSARLMSWSWLAVLISVYSVVLTDVMLYRHHFHRIHTLLGFGLFLSMGSAAAASFRRERENGVLQLLLTSPLKIQEIIAGRVRGLWSQFLPAMLLLLYVWLYMERDFRNLWPAQDSTTDFRVVFYLSTFLTIPIVGLYCSLRERAYVTALLGTVGLGMVIPFVGPSMLNILLYYAGGTRDMMSLRDMTLLAFPVQLAIAALCAIGLYRRLQRRQFSFAHTS